MHLEQFLKKKALEVEFYKKYGIINNKCWKKVNDDAVVLNFKGVLGGSFIKSNNKPKMGTILNLYCTNFRITKVFF